MKSRYEAVALVVLLAGLALIGYFHFRERAAPEITSASNTYAPIGVQNPALRFDLLQKIRAFEYSGRHRNIFSMTMPPPEAPKNPTPDQSKGPVVPPPPPPVVVPVKFFGYTSDPQTGAKRAFFTDGEEVFILSEGDTLLKRFRLIQIRNASAEFEELSTQRRATLPLEDQGPGA